MSAGVGCFVSSGEFVSKEWERSSARHAGWLALPAWSATSDSALYRVRLRSRFVFDGQTYRLAATKQERKLQQQ